MQFIRINLSKNQCKIRQFAIEENTPKAGCYYAKSCYIKYGMNKTKVWIIDKKIVGMLVVVIAVLSVGGVTMVGASPHSVVVIDAGHGGFDGGVVGASGIKESELTLLIAKQLEEKLEQQGVRVVMTRKTQNAVGKTKKQDMQNRKKIIQSAGASMVVSIHINKFSLPSRRGVQVFYDDTKVGESLAITMQNALNQQINQKYSSRSDFQPISADLFITKCDIVPSIIVECGFLSNPQDEKLLLTPAYREELAQVICNVCIQSLQAS